MSHNPSQHEPSNSPTAEHIGVGRAALLVDDNRELLLVLEEVLRDVGFETISALRGLDAIARVHERHFDLLVVDIGLPDMSGMVVCEAARAHYGDEVAIIVITAQNRTERLVTALELGADDLVAKPFDLDELLARIEAKLRRIDRDAS